MRQVFPEQQPYFGFVREELWLLMNLLHLKHVHISTNTRPQGKKSQQMIGISDTLEQIKKALKAGFEGSSNFLKQILLRISLPGKTGLLHFRADRQSR